MPLRYRALAQLKELSRPISVQIRQNSAKAITMGMALTLTATMPGPTSQGKSTAPISRMSSGNTKP